MKILFSIAIILAIIMGIISKTKKSKSKKSRDTPKGHDLRNHYGTPNIQNQYGPQDDALAKHVLANPDVFSNPFMKQHAVERLMHKNDFKPYPGYEVKMNPHYVKAGEYLNVAPSATHEVNPEITGPKLHIDGEMEYPMAVKLPTFQGFAREYHPITAYDTHTGEIVDSTALINRPIYGTENRVVNVSRKFDNFYDLRTGEKMTLKPRLKKHGIDQVEDQPYKRPKAEGCKKNLKGH